MVEVITAVWKDKQGPCYCEIYCYLRAWKRKGLDVWQMVVNIIDEKHIPHSAKFFINNNYTPNSFEELENKLGVSNEQKRC